MELSSWRDPLFKRRGEMWIQIFKKEQEQNECEWNCAVMAEEKKT